MNTKLIYRGHMPIHALGFSWNTGQEVSLEEFYNTFSSRANRQGITSLGADFANWFFDNYVSNLSSDFDWYSPEEDFASEEEAPEEESALEVGVTNPKKKQLRTTLESSGLRSAPTRKQAEANLKDTKRKQRQMSENVTKNPAEPLKSSDMANIAKNFPPPGSQVMSGDDLDRARSLRENVIAHGSKEDSPLPTEDRKRENDNKMAYLNRKSVVFTEDDIKADGSRVRVVIPDEDPSVIKSVVNPAPSVASQPSIDSKNSVRVNKDFQGFSSTGMSFKEITVDDIVRNSDVRQAKEYIKSCTSSRVLRAAKRMFWDQGNHKMIEVIDAKLASLPPVSM